MYRGVPILRMTTVNVVWLLWLCLNLKSSMMTTTFMVTAFGSPLVLESLAVLSPCVVIRLFAINRTNVATNLRYFNAIKISDCICQ